MAKKTNTTEHAAKKFETWEEVVKHFNLKPDHDTPGAERQQTGEERLLEALRIASEKMPPSEEMHTDNVVDLFGKLGRECPLPNSVTVGDLTSISWEYARKFISGVTCSVVQDDDDEFYWVSSEKYAPSITFVATEHLRLRYNEEGEIPTIINYTDADDVLPILPFSHHGIGKEAIITWGNARDADKEWIFIGQSEIEKSSDLLLAVPWGGAHSSTRGQTADEVKKFSKLVKYFEKQSSKSGGEGVDFYIIDFATDGQLLEAALRSEKRLDEADTRAETYCCAKFIQIRVLNSIRDDMEREFSAKRKELNQLYDRVVEEVETEIGDILGQEGVFLIDGPRMKDLPTEIPKNFGLKNTFHELVHDLADELFNLKLSFEIAFHSNTLIVQSYRNLVPKYVRLAPIVSEKCYGRLEIWGDAVRVFLPGSAEDGSHVLTSHQFNFTEKKLGDCIKLIRDYMTAEKQAARANKVALEDLSKEN